MSARTSRFQTRNQAASQIIKELDGCSSSRRAWDVFEDWLELIEAALMMEPEHVQSLEEHRIPATDPPEIIELWERKRRDYDAAAFDRFAHALAYLKDAANIDYRDVLGEVYMAWGWPNTGMGQYFTPYDLARAMAAMTYDRGELDARLKDAIRSSELASAALVAGTVLEGDAAEAWLIGRVIPAASPHFTPIKVSDPCCGSGVMLLATASCYPSWAVRLGLVQFYGQDLDPLCVRMAKVNLMLHGMNGAGTRRLLMLAERILVTSVRPRDGRATARVEQDHAAQHQEQATLFDVMEELPA